MMDNSQNKRSAEAIQLIPRDSQDQQLRTLEKQFLNEGGITEKLYHTRL